MPRPKLAGDWWHHPLIFGLIARLIQRSIADMRESLWTTSSVEWMWMTIRFAVIAVTIGTVLLKWDDPRTGVFVLGAATAAGVHWGLSIWLIRRGRLAQLLLFNVSIDTLTMLIGFTGSLWMLGPNSPPTDLYLALFPILMIWTVRLGVALGSLYLMAWIGWIFFSYSHFFAPDHYANEQLSLRLIFIGMAGFISLGLSVVTRKQRVALQSRERESRELRDSNEAKDEFISSLSHELRTPLTAMLGFTDVLINNNDRVLNEQHLKRLEVIRRNGRRLSTMLGDLLDLSKIESNNLELQKEQIGLNELLDGLVQSFQSILVDRHQKIEVTSAFDELDIVADRGRLEQVLVNLISNASKYSGPGTIELTVRSSPGKVRMTVKDSGQGISTADQELLFGRFFRTEEAVKSAVEGTGIGLYISKKLVELHEGSLSVDSELGIGTSMHVDLPRLSPADFMSKPETPVFRNRLADLTAEA